MTEQERKQVVVEFVQELDAAGAIDWKVIACFVICRGGKAGKYLKLLCGCP